MVINVAHIDTLAYLISQPTNDPVIVVHAMLAFLVADVNLNDLRKCYLGLLRTTRGAESESPKFSQSE